MDSLENDRETLIRVLREYAALQDASRDIERQVVIDRDGIITC